MAFGKPPMPQSIADNAHQGPETYEVNKLEATMLGGVTLPCGCVAENRWRGNILRACLRHKDNEGKSVGTHATRAITASLPGKCLTCLEPIQVGDKIHWERDVGAWHEHCEAPARGAKNPR